MPSLTSEDRHHQEHTLPGTYHSPEVAGVPELVEVGGPPTQPLQPPAPPQDMRSHAILSHHKCQDPPVPWQLVDGAVAPYDEFKPKILKEVDDFKGNSDDIT